MPVFLFKTCHRFSSWNKEWKTTRQTGLVSQDAWSRLYKASQTLTFSIPTLFNRIFQPPVGDRWRLRQVIIHVKMPLSQGDEGRARRKKSHGHVEVFFSPVRPPLSTEDVLTPAQTVRIKRFDPLVSDICVKDVSHKGGCLAARQHTAAVTQIQLPVSRSVSLQAWTPASF